MAPQKTLHQLSLSICRGLVQDSMGAQFSYIKWHRSMHAVSPLHPQTPNCESKPVQVLTEKNPHVSGLAWFKTKLQGQLDNKLLMGSNVLVCIQLFSSPFNIKIISFMKHFPYYIALSGKSIIFILYLEQVLSGEFLRHK